MLVPKQTTAFFEVVKTEPFRPKHVSTAAYKQRPIELGNPVPLLPSQHLTLTLAMELGLEVSTPLGGNACGAFLIPSSTSFEAGLLQLRQRYLHDCGHGADC